MHNDSGALTHLRGYIKAPSTTFNQRNSTGYSNTCSMPFTVGSTTLLDFIRSYSYQSARAAPDGGEPRPEAEREVVGKGKITNLQRDKEDAREVPQGNECGLVVETSANIEVGDTLRVI